MSEIRHLIEQLVARGLDAVEAAEIVTRAAIAGVGESNKSAGAVRQARYRRNKPSQTVTNDVSDGEAPSLEVSPTPLPNPNPSTHKENPPKGGQKKGSRLPSDFEPDIDWAVAQGLPRDRALIEAANFRDFWTAKAGKDAAKLDWNATWRTWVRRSVDALPRNRAGPQGPKPGSAMDVTDALLRELDAQSSNPTNGNPQAPRRLALVGSG